MGPRTKLVLVVSVELGRVEAVNAAVVTGLSLGGRLPDAIREDGRDASGADFNEAAQRSRDRDEYLETLAGTPAEKVGCVALALFGRRGRVNALTKRLPLLR